MMIVFDDVVVKFGMDLVVFFCWNFGLVMCYVNVYDE